MANSYRSGLERRIAKQLERLGADFQYEPWKIPFIQPLKVRSYTPDFILPNGIVVEAKGRWKTKDRQKFKMVAATYPDLEIRFVFSNANNTISKRSKTTYAKYCQTHGWKYSSKEVPVGWIREKPHKKSIAAIETIMNAPKNQ